jgi:hypothetical protein
MKTTATNRKIRELLTALRATKLIPRPEFQRRLVWNNKDKSAFLETVLSQYPFPEIYVAAGDVNVETGEGTEMLVDGQQRITTLSQYFTASPDLILHRGIKPYAELSKEDKEAFLQYDVVVRDLGAIPIETIKNVFLRINATRYALNAMEIQNARYEGAFKAFGEEFAQRSFFEAHRIFSAAEVRRMEDVRFTLTVSATVLGTYFYRDAELEEYLRRFNDEFPARADLEKELDAVLGFIDAMRLPANARIWKKADLFTAIVEIHAAIYKRQRQLDPTRTATALQFLYADVDDPERRTNPASAPALYYAAALHATSDRSTRAARGEIIKQVLESTLAAA